MKTWLSLNLSIYLEMTEIIQLFMKLTSLGDCLPMVNNCKNIFK